MIAFLIASLVINLITIILLVRTTFLIKKVRKTLVDTNLHSVNITRSIENLLDKLPKVIATAIIISNSEIDGVKSSALEVLK